MTLTRTQRNLALFMVCAVTIAATVAWTNYDLPPHLHHSTPGPGAGMIQRHENADHLQDLITGALNDAGVTEVQPAAPAAKTATHQATLMHDAPGVIGHDPATMVYGFHGTGCAYKRYIFVVYLECTLLVQPGTTRQWDIKLERQGTNIQLAVGGLMSAMCLAIGFAWATPICVLVAAYYYREIQWSVAAARHNHQCLRVRADIVPGVPLPVNFREDNYGHWEQWVKSPGDALPHGVYPTPCLMPTADPCVPITNCL